MDSTSETRPLSVYRAASGEAFTAGTFAGVQMTSGGAVALESTAGAVGSWTGPWVRPGFGLGEVIPSWNAHTPPGSFLEIGLQAATAAAAETGWYELGRWAFHDGAIERASVPGQADDAGRVLTDTFRAATELTAYRLRLTLGSEGVSPVVSMVSAIASPQGSPAQSPSAPGRGAGLELEVPRFAQTIHAGEYPEFGGGGASWCSPASTAMVVAFWGAGPSAADISWVDAGVEDPWVDHAARYTYDYAYGGCGNWPFNTAYAAQFGLDAFVTRLRSLREAELFVEAGVPLVASIAAGAGEIDGFPLPQGTTGHLVVVTGFTAAGDPIVNDPAAPTNAAVRRVYDRAQFERAWLGGSGGLVYVITRPGTQLPPSRGNW